MSHKSFLDTHLLKICFQIGRRLMLRQPCVFILKMLCQLMGFVCQCDSRWLELQLQERMSPVPPPPPSRPPSLTTRLRDNFELWEWTKCLLCGFHVTNQCNLILTDTDSVRHWFCLFWGCRCKRTQTHLKARRKTNLSFSYVLLDALRFIWTKHLIYLYKRNIY